MNREVRILLWVQNYFRTDSWTKFWKKITFLGDYGWFWIAMTGFLLCLPGTRRAGLLAALGLGISSFLTNVVLKNAFHRIRPYDRSSDLIPLIPPQRDLAFPSGHTCASFACAFIYLWLLPASFGIPMILLASLIGFSRIYLGVHYPSDVLAGIFVALVTDLGVVWLVPRILFG